jgi:hypothetical protein
MILQYVYGIWMEYILQKVHKNAKNEPTNSYGLLND